MGPEAAEDLTVSADYYYPEGDNSTGTEEHSSRWESSYMTIFIPILYSFIFLLGFVGNLFVIVLMAKKRGNKRMVDTFVLNLAVADMIFVCTLPLWVVAGACGNRWQFGEGLCKVSSYAINVNRCSSILFLTALSVERYLVIRKVLDTKMTGSKRHIFVTCGLIWVVSLFLGAPSLEYRQLDGDDCWDKDGEDFSLAMVFLTFILPLVVILFCYCSIYYQLHRHIRLGKGMRNSHRIIFTIIGAFICSWLPLNVCKVLLFFIAKEMLVLSEVEEEALRWVISSSTCLAFMNSCINPIIYTLMDRHFRRQLLRPGLRVLCLSPAAKGRNVATTSSVTESSLIFGVRTKPPTSPGHRPAA
ncbi:probable G-protein coupled receptor 25 [Apteryx mantelli]|uniref:Probable G-protein coupled receptor 25 n=1 Tax=Apteryx mantelli TaxID=2696672 RepID=A0A8B7J9C9_9AVES